MKLLRTTANNVQVDKNSAGELFFDTEKNTIAIKTINNTTFYYSSEETDPSFANLPNLKKIVETDEFSPMYLGVIAVAYPYSSTITLNGADAYRTSDGDAFAELTSAKTYTFKNISDKNYVLYYYKSNIAEVNLANFTNAGYILFYKLWVKSFYNTLSTGAVLLEFVEPIDKEFSYKNSNLWDVSELTIKNFPRTFPWEQYTTKLEALTFINCEAQTEEEVAYFIFGNEHLKKFNGFSNKIATVISCRFQRLYSVRTG
jgi:hypothetical protein